MALVPSLKVPHSQGLGTPLSNQGCGFESQAWILGDSIGNLKAICLLSSVLVPLETSGLVSISNVQRGQEWSGGLG